MRILLQFPEGLKRAALGEAQALEKKGNEVFVSASACYGACDLPLDEAKTLGADKIIHYGHADFGLATKIPVEYREFRVKVDVTKALEAALPKLKGHKAIALATTVQHIGQIGEMRAFLERARKRVLIGKPTGHAKYPGQVLGCDWSAVRMVEPDADCVLFFGSGRFHPAGIATELPVLLVSPEGEAAWFDAKAWERTRRGALAAAAAAQTFGILVSTKAGQFNLRVAQQIRKKLEAAGKSALILVAGELCPEALTDFNLFDVYVNTACPRLADDWERFGKPIINAPELAVLLGNK